MRLDKAEYRDGVLHLTTRDPEAIRFAYQFQAGDFDIKKAKKRRSLDANAYCWVLVDKLAEALRLSKEEVYRNAIRGIGGVSDIVCVRSEASDALKKSWESRGTGWQTETVPSKLNGCVNMILYYGSSAYDSRQMSILIDRLVQDAQALGIETMPPDRLKALTEGWE